MGTCIGKESTFDLPIDASQSPSRAAYCKADLRHLALAPSSTELSHPSEESYKSVIVIVEVSGFCTKERACRHDCIVHFSTGEKQRYRCDAHTILKTFGTLVPEGIRKHLTDGLNYI